MELIKSISRFSANLGWNKCGLSGSASTWASWYFCFTKSIQGKSTR